MNGVESARQKVVRAGEHLQSLDDKAATYLSDHQSNFVIEESNGEQQLRFVKDPPTEIAILAGEIVYQLRSALNHLAIELVKSNPIASLPEGWEDRCDFPLFCSKPTIDSPPVPRTQDQLFELFGKRHLPGLTKKSFAVVESLSLTTEGMVRHSSVGLQNSRTLISIGTSTFYIARRTKAKSLGRLGLTARCSDVCRTAQKSNRICTPPRIFADAVYVERSIGDIFISFEESALPANLADIALGAHICSDSQNSVSHNGTRPRLDCTDQLDNFQLLLKASVRRP